MNTKNFLTCALSFAALLLSGCVGDILAPREDPTQFYVLKSAEKIDKIDGMKDVPLNISLVRIPSYMTRNQIVTSQNDSSRIEISDINRWPETPIDSFTRVIASNIARIADSDEIYTYPSLALGIGAPELRVHVVDCMGQLGGELYFSARWELLDNADTKNAKRKTDIFETRVPVGNSYDAYVGAIEKALSELSLDIAKGLKEFK